MNTVPSSPRCPNCGGSEVYCDACKYLDDEPCCGVCEHGLMERADKDEG